MSWSVSHSMGRHSMHRSAMRPTVGTTMRRPVVTHRATHVVRMHAHGTHSHRTTVSHSSATHVAHHSGTSVMHMAYVRRRCMRRRIVEGIRCHYRVPVAGGNRGRQILRRVRWLGLRGYRVRIVGVGCFPSLFRLARGRDGQLG